MNMTPDITSFEDALQELQDMLRFNALPNNGNRLYMEKILKAQRQQAAQEERERIRAIVQSRYVESPETILHQAANGALLWVLEVLKEEPAQ